MTRKSERHTTGVIPADLKTGGTSRLGGTIAFHDDIAENGSQEVQDFRGERSRTADGEMNIFQADTLLDLQG